MATFYAKLLIASLQDALEKLDLDVQWRTWARYRPFSPPGSTIQERHQYLYPEVCRFTSNLQSCVDAWDEFEAVDFPTLTPSKSLLQAIQTVKMDSHKWFLRQSELLRFFLARYPCHVTVHERTSSGSCSWMHKHIERVLQSGVAADKVGNICVHSPLTFFPTPMDAARPVYMAATAQLLLKAFEHAANLKDGIAATRNGPAWEAEHLEQDKVVQEFVNAKFYLQQQKIEATKQHEHWRQNFAYEIMSIFPGDADQHAQDRTVLIDNHLDCSWLSDEFFDAIFFDGRMPLGQFVRDNFKHHIRSSNDRSNFSEQHLEQEGENMRRIQQVATLLNDVIGDVQVNHAHFLTELSALRQEHVDTMAKAAKLTARMTTTAGTSRSYGNTTLGDGASVVLGDVVHNYIFGQPSPTSTPFRTGDPNHIPPLHNPNFPFADPRSQAGGETPESRQCRSSRSQQHPQRSNNRYSSPRQEAQDQPYDQRSDLHDTRTPIPATNAHINSSSVAATGNVERSASAANWSRCRSVRPPSETTTRLTGVQTSPPPYDAADYDHKTPALDVAHETPDAFTEFFDALDIAS